MIRRRLGQALAATVLFTGAMTLLFGVARVATLVLGAQAGVAVEAPVESAVPERLPSSAVQWDVNDPAVAGFTERDRVALAYQDAWTELARAYATGDASRLDRFFTGPALEQADAPIADLGGRRAGLAADFHDLTATFVHPEGWMVVFDDVDAPVRRTWDGGVVDTVESYRVVMVVERGRWMIRSMERIADDR